jgi:glycogen phosphorylase
MTTIDPSLDRVMRTESIEQKVLAHLKYTLGKPRGSATADDFYTSLAYTVRDMAMDTMLATDARYLTDDVKIVYYLSMEYLIGRSLGNNLINLGIYDLCQDALHRMGYDLEELRQHEPDAGLGNGGLGRLAACFLDSMATLGIPGYGYGINYEFGLFRQEFEDGYQVERPDRWRAYGSPWLIERADQSMLLPIRGRVQHVDGREPGYNPMWVDWQTLVGIPYDMPVIGYRGRTVNRLRLYAATSSDEFNMAIFNAGDYIQAVQQKIVSETVSKILYPNDASRAGQELRLTQEYFLVACALRDIVRRYQQTHALMSKFPDKVAIHLNDTHPALAVAELMRILVDEEQLPWDEAWSITTRTFAYTNHTLMPEALETWPVALVQYLLPRHWQIILEINRRFIEHLPVRISARPGAVDQLAIVADGADPRVRMANLAVVGSHSVNGVAEIHTRLLCDTIFKDFHDLWPEKFNNKTNGITPRRWLLKANPGLAATIRERIGDGWITDLDQLQALLPLAEDAGFREQFRGIKRANKTALAKVIREHLRIQVDPDSMFDVQPKRLHEYKRQLMNALRIIDQYLTILDDPDVEMTPRTFVFAAKAAPGYHMAKLIIKLINSLAAVINADARVCGRLRIAFLPDYRVSLAERIIPAADLSEQISTAGKEASGTGNMKLALNGALTIGTYDGANVEIMEAVGPENIYIFGLRVEEIAALRRNHLYHPWDHYHADHRIRRVLDELQTERFSPGEPGLFTPIVESLLNRGDEFFVLADFPAYMDVQERISVDYRDVETWSAKAIRNVGAVGRFSSDRTVSEYARDIWHVAPDPAP